MEVDYRIRFTNAVIIITLILYIIFNLTLVESHLGAFKEALITLTVYFSIDLRLLSKNGREYQ